MRLTWLYRPDLEIYVSLYFVTHFPGECLGGGQDTARTLHRRACVHHQPTHGSSIAGYGEGHGSTIRVESVRSAYNGTNLEIKSSSPGGAQPMPMGFAIPATGEARDPVADRASPFRDPLAFFQDSIFHSSCACLCLQFLFEPNDRASRAPFWLLFRMIRKATDCFTHAVMSLIPRRLFSSFLEVTLQLPPCRHQETTAWSAHPHPVSRLH